MRGGVKLNGPPGILVAPLATNSRESRTMVGMASFVYVLGCRTPARTLTYVGWTTDVDRRLAQHNGGSGARSTRGRVWVLLHIERFRTRRQAMSREWRLKRDRKFRKLLATSA